MNDATRREIDKVCWKTLKEAGIVRPPVRIEKVLEFLQLHREFYDLENPGFLDPDWYEALEAEPDYGPGAFMLCGPVFAKEALDTTSEWDSVAERKERYEKSLLTTLRRYVEHRHNQQVSLIAGHSPGNKEHGVVRQNVQLACEAIERYHFGGKK